MLETERELGDMAEHMLLGVATRTAKAVWSMVWREEFPKISAARDCEASCQLAVLSNRYLLPVWTVRMERNQQRQVRICASTQDSVK